MCLHTLDTSYRIIKTKNKRLREFKPHFRPIISFYLDQFLGGRSSPEEKAAFHARMVAARQAKEKARQEAAKAEAKKK